MSPYWKEVRPGVYTIQWWPFSLQVEVDGESYLATADMDMQRILYLSCHSLKEAMREAEEAAVSSCDDILFVFGYTVKKIER